MWRSECSIHSVCTRRNSGERELIGTAASCALLAFRQNHRAGFAQSGSQHKNTTSNAFSHGPHLYAAASESFAEVHVSATFRFPVCAQTLFGPSFSPLLLFAYKRCIKPAATLALQYPSIKLTDRARQPYSSCRASIASDGERLRDAQRGAAALYKI